MVITTMNKTYVQMIEKNVYHLTFANIEHPKLPQLVISISEVEAEFLKSVFNNSKKTGGFEENEEWS